MAMGTRPDAIPFNTVPTRVESSSLTSASSFEDAGVPTHCRRWSHAPRWGQCAKLADVRGSVREVGAKLTTLTGNPVFVRGFRRYAAMTAGHRGASTPPDKKEGRPAS